MFLSGETREKIVLQIPGVDRVYEFRKIEWDCQHDESYHIELKRAVELVMEGITTAINAYQKQNGMLTAQSSDRHSWEIQMLDKKLCVLETNDLADVAKTLSKLEDALASAMSEVVKICAGLQVSQFFTDIVSTRAT